MELYKTNNTNLAAFLKARGFTLNGTETIDGIMYFCFIDDDLDLVDKEFGINEYVKLYLANQPHNRHLLVNVRDLFDARAELLDLIKR